MMPTAPATAGDPPPTQGPTLLPAHGRARRPIPGCRRVTLVLTRGWRGAPILVLIPGPCSALVSTPIRGWPSGLVPALIRGRGRRLVATPIRGSGPGAAR